MLYPSSPAPSYPIDISARWHTIISAFDDGTEQRRSKRVQDVYDVTLTYDKLTLQQIDVLVGFLPVLPWRLSIVFLL